MNTWGRQWQWHSDPLPFSTFFRYSHHPKLIIFLSSANSTQYLIMTKRKLLYFLFLQMYSKFKKQKYLIYVSIQTFCYESWNWAQVRPVSIDHPWDVSTTWLESTCGKLNWLDMIWKGTSLSIYCKVPQLTVHVKEKTKPWGRRNCP